MTYQTETTRKPVYKTVWFWLLTAFALAGAFIMFVLAVGALTGSPTASEEPSPTITETVTAEPADAPAEQSNNDADVPREWESALKQADRLVARGYSKQRTHRVLTTVHGFPSEAAEYAVDNVSADWQANADKTARELQDRDYSHKRIERVLTTVHDFTTDEAEVAVANLEP